MTWPGVSSAAVEKIPFTDLHEFSKNEKPTL